MDEKPHRILYRLGMKLPPDTIYVGPRTIWGNPWRVAPQPRWCDCVERNCRHVCSPRCDTREEAVANFRWLMTVCKWREKYIGELRGKNLACFCPLDQPCHADVLLELANPEYFLREEIKYE